MDEVRDAEERQTHESAIFVQTVSIALILFSGFNLFLGLRPGLLTTNLCCVLPWAAGAFSLATAWLFAWVRAGTMQMNSIPAAPADPETGLPNYVPPDRRSRSRRWLLLWAACALFSIALANWWIPFKACFWLSEDAFAQRLASAPDQPEPLDRVGLVSVESWARDERGGVFFQLTTGHALIDTISTGIAWRPNREGTPYGSSGYSLTRLRGDWYVFRVQD